MLFPAQVLTAVAFFESTCLVQYSAGFDLDSRPSKRALYIRSIDPPPNFGSTFFSSR